jgi:hypothetical protein
MPVWQPSPSCRACWCKSMTSWSRVSSGRVRGRVRGPSPESGKSWSRQLVRIALACGDSDLADDAVAIAAGSAARESQRLGEVLKEYDEMGASWDVSRVRGRLGVRRHLRRPRQPGGWPGLTDSELAVAGLVAAGRPSGSLRWTWWRWRPPALGATAYAVRPWPPLSWPRTGSVVRRATRHPLVVRGDWRAGKRFAVVGQSRRTGPSCRRP